MGVWLGVCFAVAFLIGVVSHFAQAPVWWLPYPTAPSWGYRVTQGLHIISGTAAIPLLLVKLWTVFPKLFARMPSPRSPEFVLHPLERASIAALVAAAVFQLASGLSLTPHSGIPGASPSGRRTTPWRGWPSARWPCTLRSSCR